MTVHDDSLLCNECLKVRRENVQLWHKTNGRKGTPMTQCDGLYCYYHQKAKNNEDLGAVSGR